MQRLMSYAKLLKSVTSRATGFLGVSKRSFGIISSLETEISGVQDILRIEDLLYPLQGHGVARGSVVYHCGQFPVRSREKCAFIHQCLRGLPIKTGNHGLFLCIVRVVEERELHVSRAVVLYRLDIHADIGHGVAVSRRNLFHDVNIKRRRNRPRNKEQALCSAFPCVLPVGLLSRPWFAQQRQELAPHAGETWKAVRELDLLVLVPHVL